MARCIPYVPRGYEPNRALIESIKRGREKAKKERKKEKKKEKKERKEKSRVEIRNHLKRKREHDEACLLHPSHGDVPNSKSDGHFREKRQYNETIMLHESGNIPKKGSIEQQLGGITVTEEEGATIYMHNSLDKQDGDSRMNAEQTAVTKISVVLGGGCHKLREDIRNNIKRKRQHDEACLLHPSSRDHPKSTSNEHNKKKRRCTEIVLLHDSGDMPKKGFIVKEQLGGSVVTEERAEATLYMHNPFDLQPGTNKNFEKTDVTKNDVGGGLRIRVPLPKHKEAQNCNQICESQGTVLQHSSRDKIEVPLITQHDATSHQVFKIGVAQQPRSRTVAGSHFISGQAGNAHQICGSQTVVQQDGSTTKVRVHATNRQAGAAHVRQREFHSSVIKQYEFCDDVSKQTGGTSEIFRTDNTVQQHSAPLVVEVCSASGEAGAAPVRQHERPASVSEQHDLCNSVGEMVDSLRQICGSCPMLQLNEPPATGRVSSAKGQPEAASVCRSHEVPASAFKQQVHREVAGEQAGPSLQISGRGTMIRKHKVCTNIRMAAVSRHDTGPVVTQDELPTTLTKHQAHHHAVGTSLQFHRNGVVVEKPKAPIKVRVSAANRQAGAIPFLRQDEPSASNIKRQAPVIKQQGCHGEYAGTSPQTCMNDAVVDRGIAHGEASVSTDHMQISIVPVRHDDLPISVNKQPGHSGTIENIHDFSSFPKNSLPPHCAPVLERIKELPASVDCSKPPATNNKKADVLSVSNQEKSGPAPSFRCSQAESLHNKRPESAVASVIQPVTPDNIDQPSFSGRKIKSHKRKDIASTSTESADYIPFRGSTRSRRQEAKYKRLVLNWKAESLQTELLAGNNDVAWLFPDIDKPARQAITGCQVDRVEAAQPVVISPSWPPRSSLLPEVDLHALPFVVPF